MGKQQVNMTPSGHYPATEYLGLYQQLSQIKGKHKVSINLKLG